MLALGFFLVVSQAQKNLENWREIHPLDPLLIQYTLRGLDHLTIRPLWEVVKHVTVVFLPVSVILDIRGRFLSLKAMIFTTW